MSSTAPAITPIETNYKGYRFRSRLEARWAVFFEKRGLRWEYEPEGFKFEAISYLPDFRVVTGNLTTWYEVKHASSALCPKFTQFSNLLQKAHFSSDSDFINNEARQLNGDPLTVFGELIENKNICPRCGCAPDECDWYDDEVVVYCAYCDSKTPCGGDNPKEQGFFGILFRPHKGVLKVRTLAYEYMLSALRRCAVEARSARFEHGESP